MFIKFILCVGIPFYVDWTDERVDGSGYYVRRRDGGNEWSVGWLIDLHGERRKVKKGIHVYQILISDSDILSSIVISWWMSRTVSHGRHLGQSIIKWRSSSQTPIVIMLWLWRCFLVGSGEMGSQLIRARLPRLLINFLLFIFLINPWIWSHPLVKRIRLGFRGILKIMMMVMVITRAALFIVVWWHCTNSDVCWHWIIGPPTKVESYRQKVCQTGLVAVLQSMLLWSGGRRDNQMNHFIIHNDTAGSSIVNCC